MSGRCPKCGRDWPINAPCSRCTQSGAALPAEHAPPDPDLEHHALMARVRDALHAAYQCGTERNRPGFQQIDGALHRFLLGVRGARGAAPERAPLLPDTFVERAVSIAQAMPNPSILQQLRADAVRRDDWRAVSLCDALENVLARGSQ